MATKQMAKSDAMSKDIEMLAEQIEDLKSDISSISGTLSDLVGNSRESAVDLARSQARDLQEKGRRQVRHLRETTEDLGHQAADAVRTQPAAAVGLAVGAGFLLGLMTGRK